jgi:cellulose synthase/poly-beta-1,6-N-acetylglucosamine synthase-like glycosyltransferase
MLEMGCLQILFWLAVGVIFYTFFGYPLLVAGLARWLRRPVEQKSIFPKMTLLIPAYNEASVIAHKIENSLALDYPSDHLDIIVVTDGSDDETPDIVASYMEQGVQLYHQPCRRGKMAAINRVMPMVKGDIAVFSDANAMIETGSLKAIARNFADSSVGGVAGEKRVSEGGEGLYWRYESFLKRCDSALSSVMGAAGELFAIRSQLFKPPPENALIDDFMMSLRLVEKGWRVVYEPEAIATEEPSVTILGEWRRRTRIAAGGFQSIGWLPGLLNPARGRVAWQYFSHRVLRWAVTPFLLPIVYGLNLILLRVPGYRPIFAAQTVFYIIAFLGYVLERNNVRLTLFHIVLYFCFTNAAALAGFWRYVTGSQPVTWVKAR